MAIIIAALVIIGLLAIVGAVLLMRGGGREQVAQSAPAPVVATDAPESESSEMPSHASLSVPLSMADGSESELPTMPLNGLSPVPAAPEAADAPESESPALYSNGSSPVPAAPEAVHTVPTASPAPQRETAAEESAPERTASIKRDTEQHVVLNGQFHELVDQLRTLHEQSMEIEQRLNALNKMVERIGKQEAMKN
ncbi:MAG TPA: hypothetical protein VGU68_02805 [Ktedonobacteraceae bacterium]|nr:hypothetical protein [Ktedonobacteraceae bacterium]